MEMPEKEEVFDFFEKNPQKLRGEFVIIVEKIAKNQSFFSNEEIIAEIENSLKIKFRLK